MLLQEVRLPGQALPPPGAVFEIAEGTRAAERLRSGPLAGAGPGYCHGLFKTPVQQQRPSEQPGEGRSLQRQAA
ncbi:hypothetical protein A4R35_13240 [Thermogemmatispora tikiterensis]|uniref:Uncharacterized protein n=1 Tax=Thermogemmatispora tikiterensis TaxID=1825093 RepID=A0A328VFM5_9CHLR|nr:hypothetical protein A4R35_13240 [Thermogemmatispora tikiterensis]